MAKQHLFAANLALGAVVVMSPPALSASERKEILVPRSVTGDIGRIYLLEATRNGDFVTALHKRVHDDDTYYTRTEFDCSWKRLRTLGYSSVSADSIKERPGNWMFIVPGSGKADIADYVCR